MAWGRVSGIGALFWAIALWAATSNTNTLRSCIVLHGLDGVIVSRIVNSFAFRIPSDALKPHYLAILLGTGAMQAMTIRQQTTEKATSRKLSVMARVNACCLTCRPRISAALPVASGKPED